MKLFDNPFSPFARKVRLVLDWKGLAYEAIDGLDKANARALEAVNARVEVPTLTDGDVTVVNSSDIVAYLEHTHPEPPVYPAAPGTRVRARAWERCADTVIDPILADISYWSWAERPDQMPAGMKEAAQRDLDRIYDALESDLEGRDFVCGDLSIADLALFPHLSAVRALGVSFSPERHPRLSAWLKRTRSIEVCRADLERARSYLADIRTRNLERNKDLLAGRSHRMGAGARLPRLVRERDRRGPRPLAGPRRARAARLTGCSRRPAVNCGTGRGRNV